VRGGLLAEKPVSDLSVRPQGGCDFSGAPACPKENRSGRLELSRTIGLLAEHTIQL